MLSAMLAASIVMQRLGPKRRLIFGSLAVIAAIGNALLFCVPKVPALASSITKPTPDASEKDSKPPVSLAAVPKLLASSAPMRLLFLCYLSAGSALALCIARVQLIVHSKPCMTEIYLHIFAPMAV